ncbi:MAG: DUF4352 domain-containing protein [Oscillochloridaceae bacterium]|nr:DUF4352 domain-containing protein [Chloroflexaceae bacterium]MDW8390777.1 DUF4352 domain-containing protein [Oscillochloridaceae bacterium]
MHRFAHRLPIWLVLVALLTACGGGAGQAPIPTATPAAEAPTSAPAATAAPPTAAPVDQPTPTSIVLKPTSEPAAGGDLASVFGSMQTFRHPSGLFSIDVPGSWKFTDIPFSDRVQNVWDSPDGNFSVVVTIAEVGQALSNERLVELGQEYVRSTSTFENNPTLVFEDPQTMSDGSIRLVWAVTPQGSTVELLGNTFVEQRGDKLSFLTTLRPMALFEASNPYTNPIINSYRIDPSVALDSAIAGGSAAPAPPAGGGSSSGGVPAPPAGGSSGGTTGGGGATTPIGQAVEVAPDLVMSVIAVERSAGNEFFKPNAGNIFLLVRVSFTNRGASPQVVSSLLSMSVRDAAGTKYEMSTIATALANEVIDGEVPAGATKTGVVGFEAPANATGLALVYEPFGGGRAVSVPLN